MSEQKLWYLVTYDVRNERRLHRVEKKVKGFGQRIQYSVFRCRLTERQLEKMRWDLSKEMEHEDDLLIVGLCENCAAKVRKKQPDQTWFDKPVSFEII